MIKYLLAHPLTRGLDIDNPRCTQIRWSIIQKKPFLRQIYEEWYSAISALLLLPQEPVLELGSGGGFLSDYIPGLITSEVFYCQHVGVILDGSNLPFKNDSLAAIVMTDVLHHLPEARGFLAEAERCVRSGGLVIMIEPWVTSWSRWVYSKLHHERFRPDALEWSFPSKGPLSGANGALPWIIFARDRTQFEEEFPELHIQSIQPFMPFRYLLSGGVSLRSFMPGWSFALWRKGENLLKPWMKSLALFALIVLRKDCIVASSGPMTGSDHEKELDDPAAGSQGE